MKKQHKQLLNEGFNRIRRENFAVQIGPKKYDRVGDFSISVTKGGLRWESISVNLSEAIRLNNALDAYIKTKINNATKGLST